MKIKKYFFQLAVFVTLIFGVRFIQASEVSLVQWNAIAQSRILDKAELTGFGDIFPQWKIKQITWPATSDVNSKKVTVDPNLTVSCVEWLTKFINKEYLPTDLNHNLIAMKEWGAIRNESEQKRLCDVFIVRFRKASYVIQIQESPYNIIMAVSDERLANAAQVSHKNLVVEVSNAILSETLKPIPTSENFHVFEFTNNGQKITRVSWAIEAVEVTSKDGKRCIDLHKTGEIGATHVEAETDGRFVRFEIVKSPGAVKNAYFDPYVERFSTEKK